MQVEKDRGPIEITDSIIHLNQSESNGELYDSASRVSSI